MLLSEHGELVEEFAVPSDDDRVRPLVRRVLDHRESVFGPCPVTDLFGVAGRELLDRLEIRSPSVAPSTRAAR
jgi:hypothetical protein